MFRFQKKRIKIEIEIGKKVLFSHFHSFVFAEVRTVKNVQSFITHVLSHCHAPLDILFRHFLVALAAVVYTKDKNENIRESFAIITAL